MLKVKKYLVIAVMLGMPCFLVAPAMADWDEGDGHKMHFPQLPDPTGWDVDWTESWLGDDWQCSQTGPVADIHLWVSFKEWREDYVPAAMSTAPISVQIWSNDPGGAGSEYSYSTPKEKLWEYTFDPSGYSIRYAGSGDQGWYFPATEFKVPEDHDSYFQINIDEIPGPFVQTEGEVYWLVTTLPKMEPLIGWKTADLTKYPEDYPGHTYGEHFMDNAVFYGDGWNEISIAGVSRDFAFVITPEPSTFVLLTTAGLGLFLFVYRKRK